MKNYLKNERGLTLIELLGAISLTAIVITVAIALFTSVSGFTYSNSEGRSAQRNAKYALSQISARLHDSDAIFQPTSANELRYSTFANGLIAYKAICYETSGVLKLYDFQASTNDEWKQDSVSISTHSSYYKNGIELTYGLSQAPDYIEKNVGDKKYVNITLHYVPTRKTATGGFVSSDEQTVSTRVKLFKQIK
ncbi:hypothetical protein PAECIP111893_01825 [Paenibacillus plantiphilus]|uniref:Prepilin-type N-terminal cleavage/methylation domain-containing protein n=1 Tax=Paenibacillus plantiphilus TaxID=2905650 RepID=A0ABN8GEU0_9BACL|nr:type II secretion system protein [Paenibacillus plantiphilus]CAH1202538.1 hypothetical protein PAECIP111893_01825 [Paenibacillus plantiphilus]